MAETDKRQKLAAKEKKSIGNTEPNLLGGKQKSAGNGARGPRRDQNSSKRTADEERHRPSEEGKSL